MKAFAVAPAKVILTGEHFVVYGVSAIVGAVNIHSRATVSWRRDGRIAATSSPVRYAASFVDEHSNALQGGRTAQTLLQPICRAALSVLEQFASRRQGLNVHIHSDIPVGVGLGSSAAVAVSTIAATMRLLRRKLNREVIIRLAFDSERLIHGIPSGIDQTISTFGGVIIYKKEKPFQRLPLRHGFPIIVGNTGRIRSTGTIVSKVRAFLAERDRLAQQIMRSAESISRRASAALRQGNMMKLGELMNQNHELLRQIEVSTRQLDRLVMAAREAGAFGAKLTGAGGGGCMIAVVSPDHTRNVMQAIKAAGGTPYLVNVEEKGVRAWLLR